jgi:hypothetical protein
MPTFHTPEPIAVDLEIGVGDVRITASDRTDTSVEVRPSDPAKTSDVTAAEQTRVEYTDGRLLVRAPKGWRRYTPRGGGESIDVEIGVPAGSRLLGESAVAALHCSGVLGECRYRTGAGDIRVDRAGAAHLTTGVGDIELHSATGHVEVTSASGSVRVGSVDGTAVVKGSNGDAWIGVVTGDLRVVSANGAISVDHAHATVVAKTARGDIRIGEVRAKTVVAQTALGQVEVGVMHGVAAWLDLNTGFGTVHNELEGGSRPQHGEPTVEVRARTSFGDITIRRTIANMTGAVLA